MFQIFPRFEIFVGIIQQFRRRSAIKYICLDAFFTQDVNKSFFLGVKGSIRHRIFSKLGAIYYGAFKFLGLESGHLFEAERLSNFRYFHQVGIRGVLSKQSSITAGCNLVFIFLAASLLVLVRFAREFRGLRLRRSCARLDKTAMLRRLPLLPVLSARISNETADERVFYCENLA